MYALPKSHDKTSAPGSAGNAPRTAPDPKLLGWSVDETATALSVSGKTVRRLVGGGLLPSFRVGRLIRIRPSDVTAFASKRSKHA